MNGWQSKLQELFGIDIRSLAVFRIGLALVLLHDLCIRVQDLSAHYTDAGVLPRDVLIDHFLDPWHVSLYLISGSWQGQLIFFSIEIILSILLLVGFYTRLSTIASWILLISLQTRNPLLIHGGDAALRLLLFWGMFLPLGAYWSLDSRVSKQEPHNPILSMASAALLLQVCCIYWFAALLKTDPIWRQEGTAAWYALSNVFFSTEFGDFLLDYPTLLKVLTFSTLFLESTGPLLAFLPIWTSPIRCVLVFTFIAFHLILGLTLELGIFSYVCAVGWTLFLPRSFWESLLSFHPIRGAPLKQNWGINGIAVFFLLYILLWNMRGVGFVSFSPQWNALGSLVRVDQYWNMFAPFPLRENGWFLIPAKLRNGKEIDLYTQQALNWERPERCSACFKNDRWRSFMLSLVFDRKHEISLSSYADYLQRQWDEAHLYEEHLLEFEIILMTKRNSLDLPPPDYGKTILWKQICA